MILAAHLYITQHTQSLHWWSCDVHDASVLSTTSSHYIVAAPWEVCILNTPPVWVLRHQLWAHTTPNFVSKFCSPSCFRRLLPVYQRQQQQQKTNGQHSGQPRLWNYDIWNCYGNRSPQLKISINSVHHEIQTLTHVLVIRSTNSTRNYLRNLAQNHGY